MNLNKSTRYALYAAMELTSVDDSRTVTVAGVAVRYGVPEGALAKVFQQMVRAGIVVGTRGVGGGYRLARHPSEITVLDVIRCFEPTRAPGRCLLSDATTDCGSYPTCRLGRLFDEVDQMVQSTYASISLETLVKPSLTTPVRQPRPARTLIS